MKYKLQLCFGVLLILSLILTACTPVTPQADVTETPEDTDGGEITPPEGPMPEFEWEHAPEAIIIQGKNCCGFVPRVYVDNYIPEFTIWGDGRYVYVIQDVETGLRTVFEAHLSDEQIASLLKKVQESGFYTWEDRYANEMVADVAEKCLIVSLKSGIKGTCEYFEGAPETFHELFDFFAAGAGVDGREYIPERGLVTSILLGSAADGFSQYDVEWDTAEMGFDITAATNGMWLEGDALANAWQVVNIRPWGSTVKAGAEYYNLSVQVIGMNPFGTMGQ